MCSRIHLRASEGFLFQFVGQDDSTSTMEKPLPASCVSNALRMARFTLGICAALSADTRSTYAAPSTDDKSSHTLMGLPAVDTCLPSGVVWVTCPGRVVGAIWPPVMPYMALLMKMTVMFSPRAAACTVSAVPMAARSPSP